MLSPELTGTDREKPSARITRQALRIDVTEHAPPGDGPIALTATVVFDPEVVSPRATLLVCWPGGSYGRGYWDLQPSARTGYSAAEHWARQGYVVVLGDHLGVGDSDRPADGDALGITVLARAAHGFVAEVRRRCTAGDVHPDLPATGDVRIVGVGHSLGGSLVITQQARHGSYDAIASIGYTHTAKTAVDETMGRQEVDARAAAVAQADQFFGGTGQTYGLPGKRDSRSWLYGPHDEPAVVEEDMEALVVWPRGPYIEALTPGVTVPIAAELSGPLFLAFSEIDIPESPRLEPSLYPSCSDITLFLVADAAHCSNFSPNRRQLWDRIGAWERSLA